MTAKIAVAGLGLAVAAVLACGVYAQKPNPRQQPGRVNHNVRARTA